MAFPTRVCSICSEEFELKPDKPGFANRCPACSERDIVEPAGTRSDAAAQRKAEGELNEARRLAMRNLLYRRDN